MNEEASHGFIKFAIAQTPGNVAGNVIQNSAGIYFDFNTPVITNTVSNTIYNCNQMAAVNFNNQTICDGDSVIASASLLFEMNTNWSVDGIFYSSDSIVTFLNLSAGIHQVDMIASNNVCDQQVTANITVNPLPIKPTFNINFNLLTSSSAFGNQWFLDGNLISGASDSTYIALANGWYSVMVTDANGCSNLSDSVFILVGGIADLQGKNVFKLKPNPATDEVEITGLKLEVGDEIFITNALGKISSKTKIERTKVTYSINVSGFQPGIYFVNIINANTISTLKMIKL